MSGSVGGSRIPRSAVQGTLDQYKKEVLEKFTGFRTVKISGSYNTGLKKDHGDIDLVVFVEGGEKDLKTVKKDFKQYLESLPDSVTVPFPTGRNKGKKAQLYGNIVTCLVPMDGFEGLSVQVDNIIVLSEKDQEYQKSFLDLPAEKQALIQGLARVVLTTENPEKVFSRMGINMRKLPVLDKNQEYEFALGPTTLALRKITYGQDYREQNREIIWQSRNWQDVIKLLNGFDLTQDYDHLLGQVAEKVTDARSRSRIVGVMRSMINVGVGEKGTPKGDNKERAISAASSKLGALEEVTDSELKNIVSLYGGGFKPPHKAHFENALKLCKNADRLIIFIGAKVREGVPITAEQSKQIWEIYKKYLPKPVEIRISSSSPISDIYKIIAEPDFSDIKFIVGRSAEKDDDKKFAWLLKNQAKFPNVSLKVLPLVADRDDAKFSASTLRKSIEIIKKGNWMPSCLDQKDAGDVLDILIKPLEKEALREEMKSKMVKVLDEAVASITEDSAGTLISPTAVVSSENKERLSQLYVKLKQEYGDTFRVQFNGCSIYINVKYQSDTKSQNYCPDYCISEGEEKDRGDVLYGTGGSKEFDWSGNAASMIGFFRKNGLKLDPLPEIILKKEPQRDGLLDKTGNYDPKTNVIEIYTAGRHPRDVMRTLAHELYHVHQNECGKVGKVSTEKVSRDTDLMELEGECYREGNLLYRQWLESLGDYS